MEINTIIVEEIQEWNGEKLPFDQDSSPKSWEYYKKNYKKIYYEDKYEKTGNNTVGYRLKCKAKVNDFEFDIAGDCSFNFNKDKKEKFKSIIDNDLNLDLNEKRILNKKLDHCCQMHHTLYNFDLMPVNGEMNNVKGNLKYKNGKVLVHCLGKPPKICMIDYIHLFIKRFYQKNE